MVLVLIAVGFLFWSPAEAKGFNPRFHTEINVQDGCSNASIMAAAEFFTDFGEVIYQWWKSEGRLILGDGWHAMVFLEKDGGLEKITVVVGKVR